MGNHEEFLEAVLCNELGTDTLLKEVTPSSGGCISKSLSINTTKGDFFIKWGQSKAMYDTEKFGLKLLNDKSDLQIPTVVNSGTHDGIHYILMEKIQMVSPSRDFWGRLGEGIGQLHKHTALKHGLEYDNYIGSLAQRNRFDDSWSNFFIEQRLEVQVQLALRKQLVDHTFAEEFRNTYKYIKELVPEVPPSLLHGDLWSGNILSAADGAAFIIDPAVYYGSREIEIAFTRLFGGFDQKFYQSYEDYFPLDPNFTDRIQLYNLYPLMVHLNMFGTSYLTAVKNIIKRFNK